MAKRSSMRASDADRERVAERLRQAAGEGRLLAHELEDRLARAFRALTYGELDPLVEDLPGPGEPARRRGRGRGRRTGWALARRYPLPTGIVALIIAVSVLAAVASIVAMAVSGLWVIPLILFFVLRGRGIRHARRYGYLHRFNGRF